MGPRCSCSAVVPGRRRLRGIGANVAGALAQTFNASDYVPPEIAADYATGKSYYDAFAAASAGSKVVNGRLELPDATQQKLGDAITASVEASVPILGQALAVLLAVAPKAGPGPGVCVTDPPAGSALSELTSWPHFVPYTSMYPAYPAAAPGTFEAFANPILEYNTLLHQNCFSAKWAPPAVLLASLVASWNSQHLGPSRTITRTGLRPPGAFPANPPNYDPIAVALEQSIAPDPSCHPHVIDAFGDMSDCGPYNVTVSVGVNNGPRLVKIPLKLRPGVVTPDTVKSPAPAGGGGLALVGVAAAAGAAWWATTPAGARFFAKLLRSF